MIKEGEEYIELQPLEAEQTEITIATGVRGAINDLGTSVRRGNTNSGLMYFHGFLTSNPTDIVPNYLNMYYNTSDTAILFYNESSTSWLSIVSAP